MKHNEMIHVHKNLPGKIEQTEQLCFLPNVYISPGNCHEDLADIQFITTCPGSQIDIIVNRFGEGITPHSGLVIVPDQGVN